MKNNLKVQKHDIYNDEVLTSLTVNENFKKRKEKEENYDHFYGITKTLRESIVKPPKNTLSELVYNNMIEELEKELIKEDISPDGRDEHGATFSWTPLYWSVKYRKIECIKLLLHYGATINMVVNDLEECCGTVLDLATLRCDDEIELILREYAEKDDINLSHTFKAIRTKLRGKAPAFNFTYYGKKKADN